MLAVWKIALRYLFAKKSHNAVNIISIISVAGVAVATIAIVCVLSVFNGFSQLAMGRLSMVDPDIKVESIDKPVFEGNTTMIKDLESLPEVKRIVPSLTGQALAIFDGRQIPVTIKGVTEEYNKIAELDSIIIDGDFSLIKGDYGGAVMSVGTALRLGARPGYWEPLALYVPKRIGRVNAANPMGAFISDSLIVSGVYQVNQTEYDADMIMIPIDDARKLLDYDDDTASYLEIQLASGISQNYGKKAIIDFLNSKYPGFRALDRLEQESTSFKMINMEKWITFVMLSFILLIASFNVVSTMSMIIIEKKSDLATLRALGASEGMISRIFMIEGWLISLSGGIIGIVLGTVLCLAQQYGKFIKLGGDPSQMSIDIYPVRLMPYDLLIVFLLVATVGLCIGWISSKFTKKVAM